jgi:WD40 repeat protein
MINVWNDHRDLRMAEKCVNTLEAHTMEVTCLQFQVFDIIIYYCVVMLQQYYKLVTGSHDTTVKMWDLRQGKEVNTLKVIQ